MPAFWLTYKPRGPASPRGWPAEEMTGLVKRFEDDPEGTTQSWRIFAHRQANKGDRIFMFKQGAGPRGIFGVGTIASHLEPRHQAVIRFQKLVDPRKGFLLRLDEINDIVPESLVKAQASGGSRLDEDIVRELERRLAIWLTPTEGRIEGGQADSGEFDPESIDDERERAFRAIRIRRGQPSFREALLETYDKRCVITGCAVVDVLEAAHIFPWLGPKTNHICNGLLLRADIHTLFDADLLAIHPDSREVVIADALKGSCYGEIAGKPLRAPKSEAHRPSTDNLWRHFAKFERNEKGRI